MIQRDPHAAAENEYDVIVVGGGIYGACLLLQAARRGLRSLLIERSDFGAATSWNSLRILHGGLRYLQTLDLPRFRESVCERRWFCRHFSDLVEPLPCLMPLYGRGLKRRSVFRAALALNDLLSWDRNRQVVPSLRLPASQVLDKHETVKYFSDAARQQRLEGAALWFDALITNPQRVLIEILRWATSLGAQALNYVEATQLLVKGCRAVGVRGQDRVCEQPLDFRGGTIFNCAGPWSREVAANFDRDLPDVFRPSLAFNLLLRRTPPARSALAVSRPEPGSQVHLLVPWHGKTLAGTVHTAWRGGIDNPRPTQTQVESFLRDLNFAIPGMDLTQKDVIRAYAGLLPTTSEGSHELTKRPVIYDHGRHGGPDRLVSLCGIKLTTARRVAESALRIAGLARRRCPSAGSSTRPLPRSSIDLYDPAQLFRWDDARLRNALQTLISEESVVTIDDLLLRRTDWGSDPSVLPGVREKVEGLLSSTLYSIKSNGSSQCVSALE